MHPNLINSKILITITSLMLCIPWPAHSDIQCVKVRAKLNTSTNKIKTKVLTETISDGASCPNGYAPVINTSILVGPQGPAGSAGADGAPGVAGADGADGALGVYGDASLGNVTLNNLERVLQNGQYQNFEIATGAFVLAESGTIVRAKGICTINGTLSVTPFARGGQAVVPLAPTLQTISQPAHPGLSASVAQHGEIVNNTGLAIGGNGGRGFGTLNAYDAGRNLLKPGIMGGGGAGGFVTFVQSGATASSGGGTFVMLCEQGIVISATGTITAGGENSIAAGTGSGGGGGGIIVLATPADITNLGAVNARGGFGSDALAFVAAGGGGGGGMVHMIYNGALSNSGSVSVNAGSGGLAAMSSGSSYYSGGGGGGGGHGDGGSGGGADSTNLGAGTSGTIGAEIYTVLDPAALFL